MELFAQLSLAAVLAGLLMYCDLDSVFKTPPSASQWKPWFRLKAWWWGFVFANGLLAAFLLFVLREQPFLAGVNPWAAALLAGAGYTAMIRLQLTTLPGNQPFGPEALYKAVRTLVHTRINEIIREWRMDESKKLAQTPLTDLRLRAILMVKTDSLLDAQKRAAAEKWVIDTAADTKTSEDDRRSSLAVFIIRGGPDQ